MSREFRVDVDKTDAGKKRSAQEDNAKTVQKRIDDRSDKKRKTTTYSYFARQGFRELTGDFSGDGT